MGYHGVWVDGYLWHWETLSCGHPNPNWWGTYQVDSHPLSWVCAFNMGYHGASGWQLPFELSSCLQHGVIWSIRLTATLWAKFVPSAWGIMEYGLTVTFDIGKLWAVAFQILTDEVSGWRPSFKAEFMPLAWGIMGYAWVDSYSLTLGNS